MLLFPKSIFSKRLFVFLLGAIFLFYLINGIFYLKAQSITFDEWSFYNYAVRFLKGQPERIYPATDNSKMPVSVLNTIPRIVDEYIFKSDKPVDGGVRDITNGRYITLFVSLFSIFFVFLWASELYGKAAGLFSAFLFSFCPNHLSNAALVTTDAYSTLFLLMTMYWLWKFCRTKKQMFFFLFCFSIATSQLVKQSLFHLYIIAPLCLLIYWKRTKEQLEGKELIKAFAWFVLINLFILNLGYYFHGTFLKIEAYQFRSDLFLGLQQTVPSWLPMPFPKPFVDGLDMAKYYDQIGGGLPESSFGNVTILGKTATGKGIWYYYFVSIFFKWPIAYFVLLFSALASYTRLFQAKTFIQKELFLFLPVVYFSITLSFFYKTQCGIRHIIFLFPFFYIFLGSLIPAVSSSWKKAGMAAVTIYLLISVLSYWKNYYPYTNEFIFSKRNAYQYVGSTNLYFAQGNYFLQAFLSSHKEARLAPEKPAAGIFIIPVDEYMDTWNLHKFDWLKCYPPIGHVAHAYLIVDVKKPCAEVNMTRNNSSPNP